MSDYENSELDRKPPTVPRWGSRTPKGLLYHYTSLEGLLGILESDCLRATHIKYMNDSKEFLDAIEHLDWFLDNLYPPNSPYSKPDLKHSLTSFLHSAVPFLSGKSGPYIISFTDDDAKPVAPEQISGDRLSQWRAYSGSSKGFSLGFDCNSLDASGHGSMWEISSSMAYLVDCLYTSTDKKSVFEGAGELLAPELQQIFNDTLTNSVKAAMAKIPGNDAGDGRSSTNKAIAEFRRNMMYALLINASTFKNSAYAEEREWRIVINLPPNLKPEDGKGFLVKFRSGVLGITPYVEFPLGLSTPDSPLRKVVVGPTPHMNQAVEAARMILEYKGVRLKSKDCPNGVEIIASKIPFRNW